MTKSFILYVDHAEIFNELSDSDSGKLIKALFAYVKDGTTYELPPALKISFIAIRQDIDRNEEKYNKIRQNRIESGRKGGLANARFAKAKQATLSLYGNVNENVNGNENVNHTAPLPDSAGNGNGPPQLKIKKRKQLVYSDQFEAWWKLYQVGSKLAAYEAWNKLNPSPDLQSELIRAIAPYKAHCAAIDRKLKDGQGWINGRFWETPWVLPTPKKSIEDTSEPF